MRVRIAYGEYQACMVPARAALLSTASGTPANWTELLDAATAAASRLDGVIAAFAPGGIPTNGYTYHPSK